MAYDEFLAERVSRALKDRRIAFKPIKMMGGLTFMVDHKMCVGIIKNDLVARVDPNDMQMALAKPGCELLNFGGRSSKGFILIGGQEIDEDASLTYWIDLALKYNPIAKVSTKKKDK